MADPTDIVVGAVLMDTIHLADGTVHELVPGGAGLYALAGAALFGTDPVLVTGTGRDLPDTFGPWLDRNHLSRRGLRISEDNAPRNILRYTDERTRTETPVFGAEHFRRIDPTPADVGKVLPGARALYIFRNTDAAFWDGVIPLLAAHRPLTLWEIALDACTPENLSRVTTLAAHVDAVSLNLEEAALLFGSGDEHALIAAVRTLGAATVFLRAGVRGSFVITEDAVRLIPSLPNAPVDVTGAGNAFGGAALIGLAEHRPPHVAAAMGTVAAHLAIGQYGPPEAGTEAVRHQAQFLLQQCLNGLEQPA